MATKQNKQEFCEWVSVTYPEKNKEILNKKYPELLDKYKKETEIYV